jgi:hypothetical protein
MSKELFTTGVTGLILDAYVYNDAAQIANNTDHVWETPSTGNWSKYVIALTENAGDYTADFPSWITTSGAYAYAVRERIGGSAADSDPIYATGEVLWGGATSDCQFVDLAYVKTQNQIATGDTTNDAQITQMIPAICRGIDKYLKRKVCPTAYEEVRNGRGTNFIRVWNPPIISLDSITFNLDDSQETEVDGANFKYDETGIVMYKPSVASQYYFEKGFSNIQVSYTGGWITTPDPIKQAAALVIKQLLVLSDPNSLITSKRVGNVQISYSDVYEGQFDDPIFATAKALLDPYRLIRY